MALSNIKIGTSGFSFPDWRKGVIYPQGLSQKEELLYYSKELEFDTLEINASYYTIMAEKTIAAIEQKTPDNFEFVVKGYRGFTHDPFDTRLGAKKPSIQKAFLDIEKFISSLSPLREAEKLGCVLLQFPVFFNPSAESFEYICSCRKAFKEIPLVIEFRNKSWAKDDTFDFLRGNDLGYCAVDEPKQPRLMPFINEITSGTAYFRLHGRSDKWFNAPMEERYNYLYSDDELSDFIPEIKKMASNAVKTYIFFNNCHAGSAVKNAQRLKQLLKKQGVLF
ncbi:MAG: DUF72 domain-containing protein [Candidatus Goldiibacteriota bacterium HGW-Goldbacteria-1]|jgi:uncharacterized protein YecE (DUF72 family)|nr:MAG: DUF72 domain-containing protein [Candidatus Goldiibacteriota bacterium HGW-Goldbacteria-1]